MRNRSHNRARSLPEALLNAWLKIQSSSQLSSHTISQPVAQLTLKKALTIFAGFLSGVLLLVSGQYSIADSGEKGAQSVAQARTMVGQTVTVKFLVRGFGKSYREVYDELYSEHSWEHSDAFFVRLPASTMQALHRAGIASDAEHYHGHVIEATGVVEWLVFGGIERPALVVKAAEDIRIADMDRSYTPTKEYVVQQLHGFKLLLHPELDKHPKQKLAFLKEIDRQLAAIAKWIAPEKLALLARAEIWVEWNAEENKSALYHSSPDWLTASGANPDKAGHIEIANTQNFTNWSKNGQPALMLHELSHVYHQQALGFDYRPIEFAYQEALASRRYLNVEHYDGNKTVAYATLNKREYFAELTEALFHSNDFYPFNRAQLKEYDPEGYALVKWLWEAPLAALGIEAK